MLRTEPATPIRWQCSACEDEGVISNWEDSPFDLRRRRPVLADAASEIVIAEEVAAALRQLRSLDTNCERLVFRIRGRDDHAILAATGNELAELIELVAAEVNHEPIRRRRQRLGALTTAARTSPGC